MVVPCCRDRLARCSADLGSVPRAVRERRRGLLSALWRCRLRWVKAQVGFLFRVRVCFSDLKSVLFPSQSVTERAPDPDELCPRPAYLFPMRRRDCSATQTRGRLPFSLSSPSWIRVRVWIAFPPDLISSRVTFLFFSRTRSRVRVRFLFFPDLDLRLDTLALIPLLNQLGSPAVDLGGTPLDPQ